jgi:DNA-directed RNA polymerase subunit RPC12/RpoP
MEIMPEDLEKFQAVCPNCSHVFDLDEDVIEKGFDDNKEYLQITCPACEFQRCPTLKEC